MSNLGRRPKGGDLRFDFAEDSPVRPSVLVDSGSVGLGEPRSEPMFVLHATNKLLTRLGPMTGEALPESTNAMGSWYGTAVFWRRQVALFVNERTLLPVLVHLAPAKTVVERFAHGLAAVLDELGVPQPLVAREREHMVEHRLAKTDNRSVVGMMNEFSYLADVHGRAQTTADLLRLSLTLARTPCGPLRSRSGLPRPGSMGLVWLRLRLLGPTISFSPVGVSYLPPIRLASRFATGLDRGHSPSDARFAVSAELPEFLGRPAVVVDHTIELERVDLAPIEPGHALPDVLLKDPKLRSVVGEDHLGISFAARSLFVCSRFASARSHRPNLPTATEVGRQPWRLAIPKPCIGFASVEDGRWSKGNDTAHQTAPDTGEHSRAA
jgi:hypothetical protein